MDKVTALLLVKGVIIGGIYALISLGFNVIYRTTGVLNFAQGEFVMLGGILAAWIYGISNSLWLALLGGVVGAGIAGLLVDTLAIRPVRKASPVVHVIITVGVSIILRSIAALIWGTDPYHLPPLQNGNVDVLGIPIERQNLWMLFIGLLCMVFLALFFRRTSTGRAMRACSENAEAARLCGVDIGKMSALCFTMSAMLAGLAGILLTPSLSMSFDRGTMLGLKGFAAAILGGLGHPVGGVAGGLLLGILEQYCAWYSSAYKETLALGLVVLALLFRPKGLFSR